MKDRRGFLRAGGRALGAFLAASCDSAGPRSAQRILRLAQTGNEKIEQALFRTGSSGAPGAGTPVAGDKLPAYFISDRVPVWDAAAHGDWSLQVGGLVEKPMRLSLDDLQRLPRVTQRVQHFCVEGWTATIEWTGVRVRDLARLAGARADAEYVDFESFDSGYHESWDRESATHPETLICYAKEGRLLGARYGAPARLHSPVKLGYKNVKYLTRVMFLATRTGGYWSDRGYEWYAGT